MPKRKRKMKLTMLSKLLLAAAAIAVIAVLLFALAPLRGKSHANLQSAAAAAEKSGDYRQAANFYAEAALKAAPTLRLHEAQKGQALSPAVWQSEIEKYMKWLAEPSNVSGAALGEALGGLARSVEQFESDNTVNTPTPQPPRPLDSLSAFTREWNQAFIPPPPGTVDWDALVKSAYDRKFSIIRLKSPMNYVYEVSIISRKTMHRVHFTLYSDESLYVPLPPAEYVMVVKSKVEQKDMYWSSAYSAFNISATDEPMLIPMDLKTQVSRKK